MKYIPSLQSPVPHTYNPSYNSSVSFSSLIAKPPVSRLRSCRMTAANDEDGGRKRETER